MATPVDKNATRTSVVSGPAYKVAVGGAPRGKPPRRYIISSTTQKTVIEEYHVTPRYLAPSKGSCHDSCKNATDEWMELKNTRNLGPKRIYAMTTSRYLTPKTASCHDSCKYGKDEMRELRTTRTLASRKRSVTKNNGVKRTVVSVERKKITEIKPKPSRASKIHAPAQPVKVIKLKKSTKPMTVNKKVTKISPKRAVSLKGSKKHASPRKDDNVMTKTQLRLMIADKITEMILQEAETAEVGVEETIDESPEMPTTESTIVPDSESSEVVEEDSSSEAGPSSSNEQVSNSESEQVSNSESEQVSNLESEQVDTDEVCDEEVVEEEYEYTDEEEDGEEEEEEDGDKDGRSRSSEGEDGERKVRFRRGRVLDLDEEEDPEKVNLKHQEVEKKEAQELLNSVIEETASKLVEDMKTKVGALVGAFETVISLQDEVPAAEK